MRSTQYKNNLEASPFCILRNHVLIFLYFPEFPDLFKTSNRSKKSIFQGSNTHYRQAAAYTAAYRILTKKGTNKNPFEGPDLPLPAL